MFLFACLNMKMTAENEDISPLNGKENISQLH